MRFLVLSFFIINLMQPLMGQQIVINELQSSNSNTITDEDGDTPDWIELFNPTDNAVDLSGWALSDDREEPLKWKLPSVILEAGKYLIVFASEKDKTQPSLHTNFKLSKQSELVMLINAKGEVVSEIAFNCIPSPYSFGAVKDKADNISFLSPPTPGYSNKEASAHNLTFEKDTLLLSSPAGYYPNEFSLEIKTKLADTKIYYTTNGSVPEESGILYQSPIAIQSRNGEVDYFSAIPTSPEWKQPKTETQKLNVIKAVAYRNGCPVSDIITNTYIINNEIDRYKVPVISLTANEKDLFGKKKGIYVEGERAIDGGNFSFKGKNWERDIHFEYFDDGKLQVEQDLGVRINGRFTRVHPQKSLRLYAKEKYGKTTIDHKFFNDKDINKFNRLILKSAASHYSTPFFKDVLMTSLIKDFDVDMQAAKPVVVFINGEYWGIHNLTERQDKYFIQNNYGLDPEQLNLMEFSLDADEIKEGSRTDYDEIMHFIHVNDISIQEYYNVVKQKINIPAFIDYYVAQIYFANYDWPHNNVRIWKSESQESSWKPMIFDFDACMLKDDFDHFAKRILNSDDPSTILIRNLLKNESFRNELNAKMIYHLSTTFEPSRVINKIVELEQVYSPLINEHITRWGEPETFNAWKANVEELKAFAVKRPLEVMTQFKNLFENPFIVYPNPAHSSVKVKTYLDLEMDLGVKIYNLQGQLLYNESKSSMDELNIDLVNYKSGLYILQIRLGNALYNEKLIIQ